MSPVSLNNLPEEEVTAALVQAAHLAGLPSPAVVLLETVAPTLLRHLVSLLTTGNPAPLPPVLEAELPTEREGFKDLLEGRVSVILPPPLSDQPVGIHGVEPEFCESETPTKVDN